MYVYIYIYIVIYMYMYSYIHSLTMVLTMLCGLPVVLFSGCTYTLGGMLNCVCARVCILVVMLVQVRWEGHSCVCVCMCFLVQHSHFVFRMCPQDLELNFAYIISVHFMLVSR